MTRRKDAPTPGQGARTDVAVTLMARAEFTRLQLEIATNRGAARCVIEALTDQRVAALEELAEHVGLVSSNPLHNYRTPA